MPDARIRRAPARLGLGQTSGLEHRADLELLGSMPAWYMASATVRSEEK